MNTASRLLITALATAALPPISGCTGTQEQGSDPIAPEVFVSAMAHLSQVHQFPPGGSASAGVEARADSLREEILREHGITAEQLIAFAEHVGREPSRMEELAELIASLNDSLTAERDPADIPTTEEVSAPAADVAQPSPLREAEKDQSIRRRLDSLRNEFRRSRS